MSETSLVLFVDLKPDTRIDLRIAARAAIAWADMVEEVGRHFDPLSHTTMELKSSEPGSQKLRAVVRALVGDPKAAIRTAIISSLIFLGRDTVTWSWEQVLEWMRGPDAPSEVQTLSEDERAAIAAEVVRALEARLAAQEARRVYEELAHDENVTGAAVTSSETGRPSTIVPRSAFPPDAYMVEEDGFQKRSKTLEAKLVLLQPVLARDTRRKWGFIWEHGTLKAAIKDQRFLEQLAKGELHVGMSEGIALTVQLEAKEELRDGVWTVKEYSVLHVLAVHPPVQQGDLGLE